MQQIGFGVIGTGIWGSNHAKVYAQEPNSRLVAVCDIDESKAKQTAEKFGAENYYTDFQELVTNPDIAAVSVATPDFAHLDPTLAAIRAGKHVLVEKPLTTTVEDAEKIVREAHQRGIKLMVDFHNRWNPCFLNIKASIDKGDLGTPSLIYIRLSNARTVPLSWFPWVNKSNVAWFLGSHTVDICRWLFNDEVKKVYCVSRSKILSQRGTNTPDFFEATLEFRKGGVAVMENTWILPDTQPNIVDLKCEVLGSEGAMYTDISHHRALEKYTPDKVNYPDILVSTEIYGKAAGFGIESIRHFVDCVVNDKQPLVTGEDGLRATQVIRAMEKSANSGKPVQL